MSRLKGYDWEFVFSCVFYSILWTVFVVSSVGSMLLSVAVVYLAVFDDLPLCCGWEYDNEVSALYVHHSASDKCPLHGSGKDGRGARVYVGKKQAKREDARYAIQDYKRMVTARGELSSLRRSLQAVRGGLSRLAADYNQKPCPF